MIPSDPRFAEIVHLRDYKAMRERFNIPIPVGDETVAELWGMYPRTVEDYGEDFAEAFETDPLGLGIYVYERWRRMTGGGAPWASGFSSQSLVNFDQGSIPGRVCCPTVRHLGYDQRNVDLTVLAGDPHEAVGVVIGRLDTVIIEAAIASWPEVEMCESCVSASAQRDAEVGYHAWGEEATIAVDRLFRAPAFDHLGRGRRLLVQPNVLLETMTDADMEAVIDVVTGAEESLTESAPGASMVGDLADAMSSFGVYEMAIARPDMSVSSIRAQVPYWPRRARQPVALAMIDDGPLLRRFDGIAIGYGDDGEGAFMTIALHHGPGGAEAATANAELLPLRARTLRLLSAPEYTGAHLIGEMEIVAIGPLLLVKVRGDAVGWWASLWSSELLLVHEV